MILVSGSTVHSAVHDVEPPAAVRDPRPRLVFIAGNGLSRSYLSHYGYAGGVQTADSLIPQPETVRYIPDQLDRLKEQPLWSVSTFPLLHALWQEIRARSDTDLDAWYRLLAATSADVPFEIGPNAIVVPRVTAALELRMYLFHMMKYYHQFLRDPENHVIQPRLWPWYNVLRTLVQTYRVSFISYNYDLVLEDCLRHATRHWPRKPTVNCIGWYRGMPQGEALVLKPHGCCAYVAPADVGGGGGWWIGTGGKGPVLEWKGGNLFGIHNKLPSRTPLFCSIVPPGHDDLHFYDPTSDVVEAIRLALMEADIVVNVGFSATPPDDREFSNYLSLATRARAMLNVDLNEHSNASQIMRRIGGDRFRFILAQREYLLFSDVDRIPEVIRSALGGRS